MTVSKIFFSYTRDDSDFALHLATDLRNAGADIWMDQLDIRAGTRWDVEVEKALKAAAAILVILSPDSVESHNVSDEISYAFDENKRVIPVLFKECSIPFRLRRIQYANFSEDYETGFGELFKTLELSPDSGDKNEIENPEQPEARINPVNKPKKKKEKNLPPKNIAPEKKESRVARKTIDIKPSKSEKNLIESDKVLIQFEGVDYSYNRITMLAGLHGNLFITNHSLRFKNFNSDFLITNITDIEYVPAEGIVANNFMRVSYYKENHLLEIYFMSFAFFAEKPTYNMFRQMKLLIDNGKFILVK